MSTFVDTGAWYAVIDRSDRHHAAASAFFLAEAASGRFATSDLVIAETWALATARLGRPVALRFWQLLRDARIPILAADTADLESARQIAQRFPDQTFSFTDCVSFAMMERHGFDQAFAFDRHFLVYRYGLNRQRAFRRLPT